MSERLPTFEEAFAPYWHAVAYAEAVVDRPVPVRLLGRDLVVWRTDEGLAVTDRYCAHRGADLIGAEIVGNRLRCEFHGWNYGRDGGCVLIPSQPNAPVPARARVRSYKVEERYGLIWTCLEPEPRLPIPDWSDSMEAPGAAVVRLPRLEWNISAGRWIENLVDVTHLSWVHRNTFGNTQHTEVPPYDVQVLPHGIHAELSYPAVSPAHRGARPRVDLTRLKYDVWWPFCGRLEFKPTLFFEHTIHLAACPVEEGRMVGFYSCTYDKRMTAFPEIWGKQELLIIEEDRVVLERQRFPTLPVGFDAEVHVRADRLGIEYRRGLTRLRTGQSTEVSLEG